MPLVMGLYSADQVSLTWGPISMTGRGPDTFCKVERNEDSFKLKVGADGETARSRLLNRSGKITVTLLQTSRTNALLEAALLADEASPNGVSVFPLMVKDYGGNALWVAPEAWIMKPASHEMAAEVGTREWVFECSNLTPPIPVHA